ncbi:MAG TPA: PBP1A family penicillin-binding protein [Vicinamibacterales bacterium]|nr:PBP1A family penicillin-binding protein [Vicinamibacterales bacterium]
MATRPPTRQPRKPAAKRPAAAARTRLALKFRWPPRRWMRLALLAFSVCAVLFIGVFTYFWISYGRLIDARLLGEQRVVPRIFGRPFEIRVGQGITPALLVSRLNDVGYAGRPKAEAPGDVSVAGTTMTVIPRDGASPQPVRIDFNKAGTAVTRVTMANNKPTDRLVLEAPLLAALAAGEKRRYIPLKSLPRHMVGAVLAIEDRRFYDHPGVDPIGALGAIFTNLKGDKPYLVGGSTLTQQIVKNTFLTPEKTLRRKLQEQLMALVLESRFSKDQILELYLNDVILGQRGPFAIHGVAEASRIFFGKDVRNVTIGEAATIAGVIQSPSRLSPFRNTERARERRNVVLREMADEKYITAADADKASREPLTVSSRALENEAPYFVDYVSQQVENGYAGLLRDDAAVDVYTTLDLQLQRIAQETVGEGAVAVDKLLAARKKKGTAQISLVAVDPKTGEILAMVGGRAYSSSQYNRAIAAQRQPGSVFKPFVYLSAFDAMAQQGRGDITPATVVVDEPTTFADGDKEYAPGNYQNEYDGPITLRRALALSRNIVAIKVAEAVGYDTVANLWKKIGVGTPAKPYPSIALGVFEASPVEIAQAYTVFMNDGAERPLQALTRIVEGKKVRQIERPAPKPVADPAATFLVTNMMRSVLNEGTGAAARGAYGFTLDAAGKSGTTNDLRDAWFVGFTPDLLTVVWVGFDDNQPIGLSGSQAALPIWARFMKAALAGRKSQSFTAPSGVGFVDIDRDTGQLATPNCPPSRVINEAFLAGTEPRDHCELHGGHGIAGGVKSVFSGLGGLFKKIIR